MAPVPALLFVSVEGGYRGFGDKAPSMTDPIGDSRESVGFTSSSLLVRVKARDQDAWRRLLHLYAPLVDFWLRPNNLQPADAHDVFQEVFRAVAEGICNFHKDRPGDRFRGWLRTIVRNKLADHFRRKAAQPMAAGGSEAYQRLQQVQEPSGPGECPDERDAVQQLRLRAVELVRGEFEERTWQAFLRVTVDGRPTKDVAEELGVTPSAVRLAKSRVLRRLREEMEGLEEI